MARPPSLYDLARFPDRNSCIKAVTGLSVKSIRSIRKQANGRWHYDKLIEKNSKASGLVELTKLVRDCERKTASTQLPITLKFTPIDRLRKRKRKY